ncbi:uncharacterized protein [Primulina huaijiensis]|uniref:uncharacterized protein n=1 Tax=Primulina huaijiensis TaxID=1492673 RepID=UPI003CC71949
MGKRRREAESDCAVPSTAEYNTVFVDTSLDTHLVMLVSDSDTVLDFKRKLMQEHAKCFPNNGEIWIQSLKVKRKGNFYHIPDFMLVCSALHGVKGNWFLSADASGSLECYTDQKASECDRKDHCGVISSDPNKILTLTMSLPDCVTEENIVSAMTGRQKVEKYSERTAEFWKTDSLENSLSTRSPAKKKRKMKYHEVVLPSPTLEDQDTQFHASGEETLQPVLAGCRTDAAEETPKIMPDCVEETGEDECVRYDPSTMECSGVVGSSIVATVTDASKQKKIKRKKKLPRDQVIETTLSSSDYCKEYKNFFSNTAVYTGNVDMSELSGIPDNVCDNNIEAPCPLKGTNMKQPENYHPALKTDNLDQFLEIKVKGKASYSTNVARMVDGKDKETDQPDLDDEQKVSSQSHDQVLLQSENLGTSDEHEAHGNTMESVLADDYRGANEEMGCGSRSKAKPKKHGGKICYDADGELSENVMHLAPLTSPSLELNILKHYETSRTDNPLPTTDTYLNVGNKNDRDSSANQQSFLNQCEFDVSTKEANSSAKLMDANGALEGIKSIGNDGKKKRFQKAAAILQDISDVELKTKQSGSTGPITRISKSRKKDEKRELSINHDLEVMLPSYKNTSASADPVVTPKIGSPSRLLDTNNLEESEISCNSRKKKAKKFDDSNLGKSAVKQTGRKAMNQPDLIEEQREVSLSHDPVPIEFEKLGTSDWHEAGGNIRESAQPNAFSCTVGEMGHDFKKKKMAKKSQGKIHDETDGEHSDNDIHLTPIAAPNLDLKLWNDPETKRTYNILPTAEPDMDVGTRQDGNLLVSHEIGMNQPEAGVAIIEPKLPSRLNHASGASDDTHNNHNKRKKKKTKKSDGKIQDTSYRVNEPQKAIGDDTLHHDLEVMPPSSSKASGYVDPELKSNGSGFTTKLLDVNMVEELKTSKGHRRKKSVKNSANTVMDNSDMDPANHGTSGSSAVVLCSQTDNFPEETDTGENISFHKVMDVQMKMLDDSAADSERKVGDAAMKESDSMKLTQTMKDVGICEQRMEKKDHNSAGDCLTVPSVIENENQVNRLEPNRAHNSIEIVCVKDKKAKKKMKRHLIVSDCLENIPIKEQEVGVEEYSTTEKANNFLDFEQGCQNVDSRVLSHKSEKNLGEIQFTDARTDNLVRQVEDKDEGVNFKHYFLSGQKQDKAAYVDKVKKTLKSSEEMKTVKKVKKRGLPSVSTSTELHNSAKLSENKDVKEKSHVRCSTGRKDGDFTVSLKVSDNEMIDSSPTEIRGMTTGKKHNENTVASPFTKDKNTPLERSVRGNKIWHSGLDVSDKVEMKTTKNNSLFAKVGSLFQDCSGESSIDENGTANSDSSTCSSADSSSQSGCSAGESELSQASDRNGSNDAQGRVAREKMNAKLDLSTSNEMTLDMILRSSKRFKKAKLIASQNELEQINSQMEFVPDSQPINE